MINLNFDLNRSNDKYYSINTSNIFSISEAADDGAAELVFIVPEDEKGCFLKLQRENSQWLQYANNQKCVDGIIISITENKFAMVYIIELKSTIGSKTWGRVLEQFRGSVLRAISFCGTIGVKINEISLYTAFVENADEKVKKMQKDINSPFSKKVHVGRSQKNKFKWETSELILFDNGPKFSHNIIKMVKGYDRNHGTYKINEATSLTKLR